MSIDNPGKELKANMTANAEIVLEEHPELAASSPRRPITYDAQKQRLRRRRRRRARRPAAAQVPVKVGVGNGTKIQVLEGLKAGDKVVLPS